jgi:hypothetical protein
MNRLDILAYNKGEYMTEQQLKSMGYRGVCFTAGHSWGSCTCKTEVSEDEGFEYKDTNIVDPSLSECGRFFIEPTVYYGQTYIDWKNKREAIKVEE